MVHSDYVGCTLFPARAADDTGNTFGAEGFSPTGATLFWIASQVGTIKESWI